MRQNILDQSGRYTHFTDDIDAKEMRERERDVEKIGISSPRKYVDETHLPLTFLGLMFP